MELVYKVGGFAVGKGGDGISETNVGAGERLCGDMDGSCLAVGTVAGVGYACCRGETRGEDLLEFGWFAKVNGGEYLQEIESSGV